MEVTRCTRQKIESPQLSRKRTLPGEPALIALWVLEASAINNWILLTPRKDLGQPCSKSPPWEMVPAGCRDLQGLCLS